MRFLFAIACFLPTISFAHDTYVKGYAKKDGTYVAPHYRTAPDSNPYNNYSTTGNVNPYTGKEGTKTPDYTNTGSGYSGESNSNDE